MHAHRFVRQIEGNELSELETYPLLERLSSMDLPDCEVDIGELAMRCAFFDDLPNNPDSILKWVEAIEQSGQKSNRERWAEAGRQRILERFSSNHQAEGLARALETLGVQVELTKLEILPGLDPA